MNALIVLAKAALSFVWLILFFNLFQPFPGITAIVLYIMMPFLLMMHGLQLLMFLGGFGDKITTTAWEKWSVLLFGIFGLLSIRRKHMMLSASA
ncbi:DUF1145 domain-containing protein [Vibrio sp. SM6]|uniref:DUF1145 domain-containing protein n=1 Tax=Vibrio agarilyticus TaxID=2726741 RepID=A0A7X8TRS0_9VIBR|nr:DUF1145 domain-containing protein [Vibrio agarilyticus]NLS13638.1 DUF1145 domain-containing protein [Vibrio agarilyticus]